jgi:hypothetical protein
VTDERAANGRERVFLATMGPSRRELIGVALFVLILVVLVAVLVAFAIPPGGPPTLQ